MCDEQLRQWIDESPRVMTGKPVVQGMRRTVKYIVNLLTHGASEQESLDEYEGLMPEDIQACLLFAGSVMLYSEQ